MTPAPSPPTPTLVIASLEGLHQALRDRAEAINISREQIDRHAGFCSGYSGKLLSPMPTKRLSVESVCKLAPALGLDLCLLENPSYVERIRSRSPPRSSVHANHAGTVHVVFSKRHIRRIAKKGGHNSRLYLPRREATKLAKKAARARWGRAREE